MRWTPGGRSADIEDIRGQGGGGRMRIPGGGRLGIGGFLVLLVLSVIFKRNFFALIGGDAGVSSPAGVEAPPAPGTTSPEEEKMVEFISFVLDDVQNTWETELSRQNVPYERAKLVLYRDAVRSGCGVAESAVGPFYCPVDHKVYVDLGFFRELRDRFGAPGDFAQAYVLAHEVGHHVQNLLGIADKIRAAQESSSSRANELSVRMELQADCLAGVWGHSTQQRAILERGDVEEALGAAAAVGDDRLQRQATGGVNPETWTHGSSEQRATWFRTGLDSGDLDRCDTFSGR